MADMFCISIPASTGGSVVEFSPATREARVRFPASAANFARFLISCLALINRKAKQQTFLLMQNRMFEELTIFNVCVA